MSDTLLKTLQSTGRFPPVQLKIKTLQSNFAPSAAISISNFLSYQFDSSITTPVDTFNFTFVAPTDPNPFTSYVREGDIALLTANDITLSTGIVDQVDIEVDNEFGEKITISGRDLMAQFEDQDAITLDSSPIFGSNMTVNQVFNALATNTRIQRLRTQQATTRPWLFATEPGESKLSALQRYLEPLNHLAFMDPDGTMVLGRPNMSQSISGTVTCSKARRFSNCLGMTANRSAATIPNMIVPVFSGQEILGPRTPKSQIIYNAASGPARLRQLGHRLQKTIVTSFPQSGSAQDLSEVNRLRAASSNMLQAYGKRELARQNFKELIVQCVMPGHLREDGSPFRPDTVWKVEFDRGQVDENMYCFQVQYQLSVDGGQRTSLFFCRLGTLVADIEVL